MKAADRLTSLAVLAGLILLCLAVGWLGGLVTDTGPGSWYDRLDKPAITPPGWVFPVVWTSLYVMMAVAAWRVWRRRTVTTVGLPLTLFAGQLALNAIWTPVFFGLQSPAGGLVVILALALVLRMTQLAFHDRDRIAGWLLVPYLLWVIYASVLNALILAARL